MYMYVSQCPFLSHIKAKADMTTYKVYDSKEMKMGPQGKSYIIKMQMEVCRKRNPNKTC